jgi:acyl carrier protein
MLATRSSRRSPTLAAWTQALAPSAIQELLVSASQPGITSFALGLPAPELFPSQAFGAAMARVLAEDPRALQYGPPTQRLKSRIVELMARRGVHCSEEQVLLTTGAQQGLLLLAHLFVDPGRDVMIERLLYSGFRQVLDLFQPRLLRAPTSMEQGIDVDAVETLLAGGARPALIYTVSEGHNPLGISMSAAQRLRLVELASAYGVPIIEDDPYGFLRYESGAPAPLRALDAEVGMAARMAAPDHPANSGIVAMPQQQALDVLGRFITHGPAQIGVMAIDWATWLRATPFAERIPFFAPIVAELQQAGGHAPENQPDSSMIATLTAADPDERTTLVREYVQGLIASVLRLDQSRVDLDQPLNTMGLDSIMAVEIKNRIEAQLRVTFSIVELLQGAGGSDLMTRIVAEFHQDEAVDELLLDLDQLSDDEIAALLVEV